jgi:signal peptidase
MDDGLIMPLIDKKSWLLADKIAKLSPEQIHSEKVFFCSHIGTSMNPTLCEQDLLEIESYQIKYPKVGDVILFKTPRYKKIIVHRIIESTPEGFKTIGDNSDFPDDWTLQKEHIYGRVVAAHRANRKRIIVGGFIGRLTGYSCLIRRKTDFLMIKLLRPAYRSLSTGGTLNRLVPVRLTPQVVTYRTGPHDSHKLLLGKQIIGTYDETLLKWQIRRPYRLFVDENYLPSP